MHNVTQEVSRDETSQGATTSLWMRTLPPKQAAVLPHTSAVDVCIIGAGIAGLSTAYECLSRGMTVSVLESRTIGSGETLRTSAHLANALDDRFTHLRRLHGKQGARLLVSAHGDAIDWIRAVCLAEGIDCEFARVPGYLFGRADTSREDLEKELAVSVDAGLEAKVVEDAPLSSMGTLPAIRFEAQAEIHMGKYLAGLAAAVLRHGGVIYEGVHVERVDEVAETNGGASVVTRDERKVVAKHVVVASNPPITSMASVPLRQSACRSYVIALEIPTGTEVPHALYWDMEEPYHYVRVARSDVDGRELLIVGGEDHKTGQEANPECSFARLEDWARSRFPFLGDARYRWSGQVMEPADSVGFVGRHPGSDGDVYVITGDSGNGLTLGTAGACIVADMMERKESPYREVFDPSRLMLRAAGNLISENANVAAQSCTGTPSSTAGIARATARASRRSGA